jgi:hypothetical protein
MRFDNFSAGLWLPDSYEASVPPGALLQADNIEYLPNGSIRGRRGRVKLNATSFGAGTKVISLHRHYPRTGTPSFVAAIDNGSSVTIHHDTTGNGTFTTPTGGSGFTTGKRWYFTHFPSRDRTFMANGSNALRSYDGTTVTVVSQTGVPANGPYIAAWKGRLWATKSDQLSHAIYASDLNDETNWPGTNALNLSDRQGGVITGIMPLGEVLLFFKKTTLWRFVGDIEFGGFQLAPYSDRGCIAPDTIQLAPYGVYYLAQDGLRLTDGQDPDGVEVSRPIRPLFVSRSDENAYVNAVGVYHPRDDAYYLTINPAGSTVYVCHRLRLVDGRVVFAWSRHTSLPMHSGTSWSSGNDEGELFAGDTNGTIWKTEFGTMDDTAAISSTIKTAPWSLDQGRRFAASRLTVQYRGSVPLSYVIEYDQNSAKQVSGSVGATQGLGPQYARTDITNVTQFGRYATLSLTNASDSYNFELSFAEVDERTHGLRAYLG